MDAFGIEKARQKIAEKNEKRKLKSLYNNSFAEINNLNTAKFWNTVWKQMNPLKAQDGMTQDRVKTAANFIPKSAKQILDIGAGYGFIEELLQNRDINLIGTDISDESVQTLKNRFKGKFKKESIYSMNYEPRTFDTVLLLEVLEHIPPSMTFSVLKTIRKILKPHSYFILSVPTNEGLEKMSDNPNGHMRMYTPQLISAELEIAGFKVLKMKTFTAFKSHYTIKKFIAKIIKYKWQANDIVILAQKTS
jgi:2-polyprenyl-3-methyl-5-hydroxy-6-metoxy-1,4-benzoquinol methylase